MDIKFRAWDERVKRMIGWGEICEGVFTFNDLKFDFVKWMQFTGLKDKNGKEIFEGDILKNADGFIVEVAYSNGEFHTLIGEKESLKVAKWIDEGNSLREYERDERKWHDCEVIGNIYKNPELLNDASSGENE